MDEEEAGRALTRLQAALATTGFDWLRAAPVDFLETEKRIRRPAAAELEGLLLEVQSLLVDGPKLAAEVLQRLEASEVRFEPDPAARGRSSAEAPRSTVISGDNLRVRLLLAQEASPLLGRLLALARG